MVSKPCGRIIRLSNEGRDNHRLPIPESFVFREGAPFPGGEQMTDLPRLRPEPIPAIHPLPEYLAGGPRKVWYEDMKQVFQGALDGGGDHGLRPLSHLLRDPLAGRARTRPVSEIAI